MSLESEVSFSFDFLQHLNATYESKIYSPSSVLHLLSMIYAGADGNTARQISKVIGKGKSRKELIEYYSKLAKRHKSKESKETIPKKRQKLDDNENVESVKIYVANKIFIQNGFKILPNYLKIVKEDFESDLEEINFGDNSAVVTAMNGFVKTATKEMISQIVSPEDSINPQTIAAMINAVYFNGFWEEPFDERKKRTFYSNPQRQIDFMSTSPEKGDWNFRSGKDWEALGIPYKFRKAWMFIVLPKAKDGLAELIKKANYKFFENVTKRQRSDRLGVTIPLIDIETKIDLPEYLNKFGITDAFNERCDLSKMFECSGNTAIEKALHKATIKVDERGTEASAASMGTARAVSAPGFFAATHPFFYFITSTETSKSITPKDILFIGTFC